MLTGRENPKILTHFLLRWVDSYIYCLVYVLNLDDEETECLICIICLYKAVCYRSRRLYIPAGRLHKSSVLLLVCQSAQMQKLERTAGKIFLKFDDITEIFKAF
jgi:hypothetical protein